MIKSRARELRSVLSFTSHGAPNDVVFVHGAGENSFLWRRTLEGLSGRSRAIAVDLPGHPSGDITCRSVEDYADAVRAFIREAGVERPAICGHSMGGAVSLTLPLTHPGHYSGLILLSTGAKLGVAPE